jgi:uncharacterized protein (DUF433 family)
MSAWSWRRGYRRAGARGGPCREALCRQGWPGGRSLAADRADRGVTAEQLELISTDPQVMHGQSVLTGTKVPVSVILDCLAAGMTVEEIIAEIRVTAAGVRAAVAYGAALARCGPRPVPAPCGRGPHV